ncbi:MAG: hypothetical protein Tsb0013_02220 [Phycisphaerales bacterium]
MNTTRFLEHWKIVENPFRAEEARHDPVFSRLGVGPTTHPDFEKIAGDLTKPSTAVVFGEKGSGKTAIRLQLEQRIAAHNEQHPDQRVALIPYDDLNPVLDRLGSRLGVDRDSDAEAITGALEKIRLVDHIDALLSIAVTRLVDTLLGRYDERSAQLFGPNVASRLRRTDRGLRTDALLLAAVYDAGDNPATRIRGVRKALGLGRGGKFLLRRAMAYAGWLLPAGGLLMSLAFEEGGFQGAARTVWLWTVALLAAVWLCFFLHELLIVPWRFKRSGQHVHRQVLASPRAPEDHARALAEVNADDRAERNLPVTEADERRYAMLGRLRRVLRALGAKGVVVVVDRVDEPTLINGDTRRMRAVVWPLLNNKFLQQEDFGLKLLLPLELRHELFRESSGFFQEARLDKQNLVERLEWTGATLYDLCNARLAACREEGADPISLVDLFDDGVTRQDVIDALDQMHQPRDAFKLIYKCVQDHCANTTEEQAQWRIPKLTLDAVRRVQVERVQMFYRGIAPA